MIFTRHNRRVIRALKTEAELMDEIVDSQLYGMTPEQMRRELAERMYRELEEMTDDQFRQECERLEIEDYNEWED